MHIAESSVLSFSRSHFFRISSCALPACVSSPLGHLWVLEQAVSFYISVLLHSLLLLPFLPVQSQLRWCLPLPLTPHPGFWVSFRCHLFVPFLNSLAALPTLRCRLLLCSSVRLWPLDCELVVGSVGIFSLSSIETVLSRDVYLFMVLYRCFFHSLGVKFDLLYSCTAHRLIA